MSAAAPSRYRTIVADPPWPIGAFPPNFGYRAGKQTPYQTMAVADIAALPVSDWAHAGAHLYLWTISEHLEASFGVARSWGFEPSALLVWCKPKFGMGLGGKFVNTTEFVLFCRDFAGVGRITEYLARAADRNGVSCRDVDQAMGTSDMAGWWLSLLPHRAKCPLPEQYERLKAIVGAGDDMDAEVEGWNAHKGEAPRVDTRWFTWPRGKHSEKPEAFLDLVEQVSPAPRLEMFARRARFGWDYWGDESLGTAELMRMSEQPISNAARASVLGHAPESVLQVDDGWQIICSCGWECWDVEHDEEAWEAFNDHVFDDVNTALRRNARRREGGATVTDALDDIEEALRG